MPIFEYKCSQCNKEFEKIIFGKSEVHCPDCQSSKVKRLLSIFGIKNGGDFSDSSLSGNCNGCAATNCSTCK